MGIQIDLIIPPIIVGLLVIVIFRLNAFIMETSVDNQINNDMQTFAEVTSRLIQEEVKRAAVIEKPINEVLPDTVLKFFDATVGDTVWVQKSDKSLEIIRKSQFPPSIPDTISYPLSISFLEFDLERKPMDNPSLPPYYLNVKIRTESNPDHHASMRDLDKTVMGFAENEIYLRNVHRNSIP